MKCFKGTHKAVRGVVLSGGEGKRLRPLSYYFQKCMIPVGSRQNPLLEYVVRLLKYHGITDITLLGGYKHEQIVNYFNNGKRFGVYIKHMLDDPTLGGTGGSLLNAYRKGAFGGVTTLLIYYGDILSNVNLTELLTQHWEAGAVATLALAQGYQIRVGMAEVRDGKVVGWTEKPKLDIHSGIGILALEVTALDDLERLRERYKELDIMGDFVPFLIKEAKPVSAYVTDAFWYDVGSTDRYEKLDNSTVDEYLSSLFHD